MVEPATAPPAIASGDFILIGARIEDGKPSPERGWQGGAATLAPNQNSQDSVTTMFQTESNYMTPQERASSFTAGTARRLFPELPTSGISANDLRIERWHYQPERPLELLPGIAKVVVFEALILAGVSDIPVPDRKNLCIVIAHLESIENSPGRGAQKNREAVRNIATILSQAARPAKARKSVLAHLQDHLGAVFDFSPLPNDSENLPIFYPVITALGLTSETGEDPLAAREVATMNPAKSSANQEARIRRTADEFVKLSDDWGCLVTGKGTIFISSSQRSFEPGRLYVSSIYADAMATCLLTRAALVRLNNASDKVLQEEVSGADYDSSVKNILEIRRQLLKLHDGIADIHLTESAHNRAILTELRSNFRIDSLEETISARISDILETLTLHRDVIEAEEKRASENRQQWTNIILATLALISLPLTVFYGFVEILNAYPHLNELMIRGTLTILLTGGCVVAVMFVARARSRKK
jgi:hypothetical protein